MNITTGKVEQPPRVIVCGVEKIGKSTFASQFPGVLMIPVMGEQGVDDLEVSKTDPVNSYDELMENIGWLYEEKHDFETVVLDSTSSLEPFIFDAVLKEHGETSIEKVGGGFGKGYVYAGDKWRELTRGLDALRSKGMASVLIGHVIVRTFMDPLADVYDVYELDINKKASALLQRWADAILFANNKITVKSEETKGGKDRKRAIGSENQRRLYTQKRPTHPGGGRGVYGQLPYELELSYKEWTNAIVEKKGG